MLSPGLELRHPPAGRPWPMCATPRIAAGGLAVRHQKTTICSLGKKLDRGRHRPAPRSESVTGRSSGGSVKPVTHAIRVGGDDETTLRKKRFLRGRRHPVIGRPADHPPPWDWWGTKESHLGSGAISTPRRAFSPRTREPSQQVEAPCRRGCPFFQHVACPERAFPSSPPEFCPAGVFPLLPRIIGTSIPPATARYGPATRRRRNQTPARYPRSHPDGPPERNRMVTDGRRKLGATDRNQNASCSKLERRAHQRHFQCGRRIRIAHPGGFADPERE